MSETRYLNESGEVVSLERSQDNKWIVMAEDRSGKWRVVNSKFLPPRRSRAEARINLDHYAAVKGWKAVEEAPALF